MARPTHRLLKYHGDDDKYPTEIGAAWPTKEGDGFSIEIKKGIAVAGRVILYPIKDDDDKKPRNDDDPI